MKKFYAEPEFEIVNIRLVADVLMTSSDTEIEVPTIDGGGMGDFENGDF